VVLNLTIIRDISYYNGGCSYACQALMILARLECRITAMGMDKRGDIAWTVQRCMRYGIICFSHYKRSTYLMGVNQWPYDVFPLVFLVRHLRCRFWFLAACKSRVTDKIGMFSRLMRLLR